MLDNLMDVKYLNIALMGMSLIPNEAENIFSLIMCGMHKMVPMISNIWYYSLDYVTLDDKGDFADILKDTNQLTLK